jgi:hypothetical protein
MNKIDLVNSEGPILVLIKENDLFLILDENKKELVKLTRTALNLFFNGQILIKDSMNREWNFTNVIDGMKVDTNELEKFLEDEK